MQSKSPFVDALQCWPPFRAFASTCWFPRTLSMPAACRCQCRCPETAQQGGPKRTRLSKRSRSVCANSVPVGDQNPSSSNQPHTALASLNTDFIFNVKLRRSGDCVKLSKSNRSGNRDSTMHPPHDSASRAPRVDRPKRRKPDGCPAAIDSNPAARNVATPWQQQSS